MGLEERRLFRDLADLGKRHDLEAAAVSQDRALPADELVKPAELRHLFRPRPEHQVIGVAEDDVRACALDLIEVEALDCADSPHRHEGRGADVAMEGADGSEARRAIGRVKREAEFNSHGAGNSRLASP